MVNLSGYCTIQTSQDYEMYRFTGQLLKFDSLRETIALQLVAVWLTQLIYKR